MKIVTLLESQNMKRIALLILFFIVISCRSTIAEPTGNNYYFENPQPVDYTELTKIPPKFHGIFMSPDSTFLNIRGSMILSERFLKFKVHRNKIDSLKLDFDYVNGTYTSKVNDNVFETNKIGDSIELFKKEIDTLFRPSTSQKIKQINGYLILNTNESIYWKIRILNFENNLLKFKSIYSDEDLKKINKVTKNKSEKIDSSSFIIRPTNKEFKNILSLKQMGEEEEFRKVGK